MQQHRSAYSQSPVPVITGAPLDGPADCTLACDEGHLTAHKIMLCAHSKYLQDILSKFPNAEHPIIILTELNITDIKILVNYMYTGELVISNEGSPCSLLRAAQILKIDSLTDFDDDEDQQQPPSRSPSRSLSPSEQIHFTNQSTLPPPTQSKSSPPPPHSQPPSSRKHPHNNRSPPIHRSPIHKQRAPSRSPPIHRQQQHHQQHQQQQQQQHSPLIKDSNNKIKCHLCNIGLSDVKCLYRHVLTRHLPQKWGYKCEFCDREFSRDDHLMRHYTTKHKNMDFNREKIRETRRLNREMAKNFHDQISKLDGLEGLEDFKDELSL